MLTTYIESKEAARVAISEVLPVIDGKTGIIFEVTKYDVNTGEPIKESVHYFIEDLQNKKSMLQKQIDEINAIISDAQELQVAPVPIIRDEIISKPAGEVIKTINP